MKLSIPCSLRQIAADNPFVHSPCPSSGSELVVLPSLSPDSSDTSEELPQRMSSLASKYSAAESATEGAPWDEFLAVPGFRGKS